MGSICLHVCVYMYTYIHSADARACDAQVIELSQAVAIPYIPAYVRAYTPTYIHSANARATRR
jgi:hypothetical protein